MSEPRSWWRAPGAIGAGAGIVFVAAASGVAKSLTGDAGDSTLFLGRFHPLAVHLPIGILLLVAAAEAASFSPRLRARVDPAIGLALPVTLVASVAALLLGLLLARSGDFAPRVLALHQRLETVAVLGVCLALLAWTYQTHAESAGARLVYRVVLALTVGVLSVGAHFGGVMTRGDSYLAQYAPGPLKPLLGGGPAKPVEDGKAPVARSEPTFFEGAVQPILRQRCVGCHGPEKVKGSLRLDSLKGILKGGDEGAAVTPGVPERSPLLTRTLLPLDDDDRMPPKDKPGPTPAEITVVRFWIERGANDALLLRDAVPPSEALGLLQKSLAAMPVSPAPAGSAPPASSAPPEPRRSSDTPTSTAPEPPSPQPPSSASERSGSAPAELAAAPPLETIADSRIGAAPGARSPEALLAAACGKCHGAKKQKGKLRTDSLEALLEGGKQGPAVVPGAPHESELMRRIRLPASDEKHMPPAEEPQLAAAEVSVLATWIRNLSREPRTASAKTAPTAPANAPNAGDGVRAADPTGAARELPASSSAGAGAAVPHAERSAVPEAPAAALSALPPRLALYSDAIAPMLADRCGKCHSGERAASALRIDDHAAILKGGYGGPAVIAGKPDESPLVQRVSLPPEDGDHMPPEGEPDITPGEVALLRVWVERGASVGFVMDTKDLPRSAQEAVASRPPKPRDGEPAAALPEKSGGCAACSVGRRTDAPAGVFSALALGALASLRRRTRGMLRRSWRTTASRN